MKLAEALLRRKELNERVARLAKIAGSALFEVRAERINVTDSVDDIVVKVPKLTASQVDAEYNHYSKCLRSVDAIIQKANWDTDVTMGTVDFTQDYVQT